jgi:hypothetical protein
MDWQGHLRPHGSRSSRAALLALADLVLADLAFINTSRAHPHLIQLYQCMDRSCCTIITAAGPKKEKKQKRTDSVNTTNKN